MLSNRQITILSFCVLFNTLMSASQWCIIALPPVGSVYMQWLVNTLLIWLLGKEAVSFGTNLFHRNYLWPTLFIIWAIVGIVRGMDEASDYWMWKQLMTASFSIMLPIVVYAFSDEEISQRVCRVWVKWMILAFPLLFIWNLSPTAYHFLVWPVFFYAIFAKYLPKRWMIIVGVLFFVMMSFGYSARAQGIKVIMSVCLALAVYLSGILTEKILKLLTWAFYFVAIVLVYLGVTGAYNAFESLSSHEGEYVEYENGEDGELVEIDASADTRTFIYEEVIQSAVKNDYIWTGRTPARGNDSPSFGRLIAEQLGVNRWERPMNEVCHPNIFTWLGLIGVVLYALIYFSASWLAMYRSRSFALKVLGCFVAFHWALGWLEDCNRFSVDNIFLWMCIAMCLSPQFRSMDEVDFKLWFKGIFRNVDAREGDDECEEEAITEGCIEGEEQTITNRK